MVRPVLYTRNMRFFYAFLHFLKTSGIYVKIVGSPKEIPAHTRIVFTSCQENDEIDPKKTTICALDNTTDAFERMIRAYRLITNEIDTIDELIIGVDPGSKQIGVAVLAGSVLIEGRTLTPEQVQNFFRGIFSFYNPREFVIKIGRGQPSYFNRILSRIRAAHPPKGTIFQEVDEVSTTKMTRTLPELYQAVYRPHTLAAIHIALKESVSERITLNNLEFLLKVVEGDVEFSRGEIKSIQKMSRAASNGKISISSSLAKQVLNGRLTLQEALRKQAHRREVARSK